MALGREFTRVCVLAGADVVDGFLGGSVRDADELLGLVSALIPLGTNGLVASVVPVNDAAAVPLMTGLHRGLRRGASLAEALRDARQDLAQEPTITACGWSFVALGAG